MCSVAAPAAVWLAWLPCCSARPKSPPMLAGQFDVPCNDSIRTWLLICQQQQPQPATTMAGSSTSTTAAAPTTAAGAAGNAPSGLECPVDHANLDKDHPLWKQYHSLHKQPAAASVQPVDKPLLDASATAPAAPAAPTATAGASHEQPSLASLNNMPAPSQLPAPGQAMPLSTEREASTIPMGGVHSGSNWIYPSEQMFFNAMRRKNWNPDETDMSVVVPIHNAVNERCWQHILDWESMHKTNCAQPKLLKFQGRPRDYSPKARIRQLFGYKLPFDRHDWVVDRCGTPVTYVIDFYSGASSGKPGEVSFYLDVRPAISLQGIADRLRKFVTTGSGLW
ncbi:cytochrome c/c1 heme lyase-domain-containing protein [Entophlyctis helioformis]|nr:cytochrome c/c1 heme lyase-domain-containing protein [Entophlyctis helioformis]